MCYKACLSMPRLREFVRTMGYNTTKFVFSLQPFGLKNLTKIWKGRSERTTTITKTHHIGDDRVGTPRQNSCECVFW